MPICNKCLENKRLSEFATGKSYKNGKRPTCKECWNAYNRAMRPKWKPMYTPKRNILDEEDLNERRTPVVRKPKPKIVKKVSLDEKIEILLKAGYPREEAIKLLRSITPHLQVAN